MKALNLTLITTALISLATPALAADGLYISGGFNSTTQEQNQSRNTGSNQPNVGPAGGASGTVVDKETGFGFVGGVGYKARVSEDFFISAEAFYSAEDVTTIAINNVKVTQVDLNATYGVDLRFGTDVTDKVAIYGLAGATAHDIDGRISYTFAPPVDEVSETVWGLTYGGGVELAFNDRLSTFGEFRLVNDLSFDTPVDRGAIQSQDELNYATIRTGLRFSF